VFTGTHERLAALLREFRGARVQDPAAAAPVQATAALSPPPVIIIDACAGRGTKTSQLAALHPQAQIVATDIDPARLEVLSRTFAGHPRVAVVKPGDLAPFIGRADLLLLDVPCTNTGVLARRLEAKYRFTRQALARLVERQRQIAADHLALLKPDGRVLYATCSLEPAENEQQAQWLTRWHPMMVEARGFTQPAGLPGEAPSRYHDGGFFALLRRTES
jgi:16S rRNA (cytosine967-C5)-methyltransferase